MANVVFIDTRRTFTLEEARALLPVVRRVTERFREQYYTVKDRILATPGFERRFELEEDLQDIVRSWARTIERLGGRARPMWTVDFDSGHGYFCWQYPEPTVSHFHKYEESFPSRVRLRDEPQPDNDSR